MVDRQVIETNQRLTLSRPKNRRRRTTMYPARTPLAIELALAAGGRCAHDGRLVWTFHSLRHVFATWALSQPGARIEDVSRLMGHSSVRITQDIYVSPDGNLFGRFYELTK